MTISVWSTKEGRRAIAVARVVKWPLVGALIGGGALAIARMLGPSVADSLGRAGGQGFARGVAQAQVQLARVSVSGGRGARFR